jgi:hypothetical protein
MLFKRSQLRVAHQTPCSRTPLIDARTVLE